MSIEDEIWDEFNTLSESNLVDFSVIESMGRISKIDQSQKVWYENKQIATDELVDKCILGEKKWDQVVDDLPKRIITEVHEPYFHKLNNMLLSIFRTQDDAVSYLEFKRFANAFCCVHCGNDTNIYLCSEGKLKCSACGYYFKATTKSIFHATKMDLTTWYGAMVIMSNATKQVSTHALGRVLRITQKTSYYMARKIKDNLNDPFIREVNRGIFEYKPSRK